MTQAEREAQMIALMPVAQETARRFHGIDQDEALSVCYMAIVRAVDTWRPAHGATLEVYTRRAMHNALLNAVRSRGRWERRHTQIPEEML